MSVRVVTIDRSRGVSVQGARKVDHVIKVDLGTTYCSVGRRARSGETRAKISDVDLC